MIGAAPVSDFILVNLIALGKAKIAYNFGLSECNRVKVSMTLFHGPAILSPMILILIVDLHFTLIIGFGQHSE